VTADGQTEKPGILQAVVSRSTGQRILCFLGDIFTPDLLRRKPSTRRLGSTAWLDGLRGWAAFCVCFHHLMVYSHHGLELCYGHEIDAGDKQGSLNTSPVALPFIRLFFVAGHFAVILFFTISGYVVPRRLISLLHEGRRDEFLDSVQSAMVRRPVRLFLPVIMSTLLLWIIWHVTGIKTNYPEHQPNIFLEGWKWFQEMLYFLYFFRIGLLFTNYNAHSWTIPVEFRGSMFLLVWLFAMHTLNTKNRLYFTIAMTLYLIVEGGAWYAAFFAGMVLSELDLLATTSEHVAPRFPWDGIKSYFSNRRVAWMIITHLLFLIGIWLGSQPSSDFLPAEKVYGKCFGWETLGKLIPNVYIVGFDHFRWFWLFWGGGFTLYSIKEISWIRSLFESNFAQRKSHPFSPSLHHIS
jgi:peptidoglycan/LPS O-acetylase OafA/YrhL